MSVIVKGMKMPSECARVEDGEFVHCPFVNTDDDCILQSKVTCTWEEMYQNCPLVALPDKHGRLVDADVLIKFVDDRYDITWESDNYEGGIKDACTDILEKIDTMPTIVEAEGENADHN